MYLCYMCVWYCLYVYMLFQFTYWMHEMDVWWNFYGSKFKLLIHPAFLEVYLSYFNSNKNHYNRSTIYKITTLLWLPSIYTLSGFQALWDNNLMKSFMIIGLPFIRSSTYNGYILFIFFNEISSPFITYYKIII